MKSHSSASFVDNGALGSSRRWGVVCSDAQKRFHFRMPVVFAPMLPSAADANNPTRMTSSSRPTRCQRRLPPVCGRDPTSRDSHGHSTGSPIES
eukprot:3686997-Prymnesium_polylepis.1